MSQLTSQKAAEMIGNRFDLVLIASARARELHAGAAPMVAKDKVGNKNIVTALKEIEEGHIGREYLAKVPRN
jgi:DNA-directed RNA polymerase subunit omega